MTNYIPTSMPIPVKPPKKDIQPMEEIREFITTFTKPTKEDFEWAKAEINRLEGGGMA